jgi:hypothetical protein
MSNDIARYQFKWPDVGSNTTDKKVSINVEPTTEAEKSADQQPRNDSPDVDAAYFHGATQTNTGVSETEP